MRTLFMFWLFFSMSLGTWAQMGRTRSVRGTVTDQEGRPVANAVVKLENTVTLQVRSYITRKDGTYDFHGLSTEVDYELRARTQDGARTKERLAWFDSRKEAVVNLQVENQQ